MGHSSPVITHEERPRGMSDLDAIINGSSNPSAVAELERLRRLERAARRFVNGCADAIANAVMSEAETSALAELRAAVSAVQGGRPRP